MSNGPRPAFPGCRRSGTPEARRISTRSAYTLERATRHDSHTPSPAGGAPIRRRTHPPERFKELPQLVSVPPPLFFFPLSGPAGPRPGTRAAAAPATGGATRTSRLTSPMSLPRAIAATRPRAFRCSLHRFGRPFRPSSGCSPKSCSSDLRDIQCLLLNHCPAPPCDEASRPLLSPRRHYCRPQVGLPAEYNSR